MRITIKLTDESGDNRKEIARIRDEIESVVKRNCDQALIRVEMQVEQERVPA